MFFNKEKPQAVDLAEKLIITLDNHDLYTNTVDIHNFLYILWCKYFKETNNFLFNEKFVASHAGPRINTVSDRFCPYAYEIHTYGGSKDIEEEEYFIKNIFYIKKLYRNARKLRDIVKTPTWKRFFDKWDNKGYWMGGFNYPDPYPEIPTSCLIEEVDNILNEVENLE